ncbi:glycosyl hydrolase family 61-domain-containing protein [Tricharina praecox]|uniref:glycosyl hydrolase family 61-domain-containing protein n=1 Tax=Tricharina praecox TaxID=43433 RepID=UPI00221F680B|nr:glycosyl hydrolase family 61-domain-containing protein [Tricharina praecox]KAI5854242.1 glycosyl hydrolase family 61-domain-containing protein [Tricharina praecox]
MKLNFLTVVAMATSATAHSTWQQLWVNGVDQAGTCVRTPLSNSPVGTLDASVRCGTGSAVAATCSVPAGGTVTIEMHAQPNDRSCTNDAIGGNHDGPVIAYLSKVGDATTDPGTSWFKIHQTGLVSADYWGTDVINANCGKQDVLIPADIAPGDYLLRAEVIALHVAGSSGGAQHYVSCMQLKVTGGGSANPSGVAFPGGYSLTDPGILFNLYGSYTTYTVPGPAVYTGGASSGSGTTVAAGTTTRASSTTAAAATSAAAGGTLAKYAQCGGNGWTGTGTCVTGSTCTVTNEYYSQCL